MYFQHALGGQHPSAVVGMEQPFVERLEGGGAEAADGDAPQGRHDVTVNLAAVAVPGIRAQCQPLAGQPDGGEAGAEAQRTHRVVGPVALAGELGFGPVCARRVPTATLPARDRVEPFVDHRLPAVALASHVSLHHDFSIPAADRDPVEESVERAVTTTRRSGNGPFPRDYTSAEAGRSVTVSVRTRRLSCTRIASSTRRSRTPAASGIRVLSRHRHAHLSATPQWRRGAHSNLCCCGTTAQRMGTHGDRRAGGGRERPRSHRA